jgi:hypothetical protein
MLPEPHSMPGEADMRGEDVSMLTLYQLEHQRDSVAAQIAQKRLELFELGGSTG